MAGLVRGTAGDDTLLAGTGPETLDGSLGWDTVSFAAAGGGVLAVLYGLGYAGIAAWWNPMPGSLQDYSLPGIEALVGSAFADSLQGGYTAVAFDGAGGDDTLAGTYYADHLSGGDGNDLIYGMGLLNDATAVDTLEGGAGADTLYAASAANRLSGGAGADRFLLPAAWQGGTRQIITEFDAAAGDRIGFYDPSEPSLPILPPLPGYVSGAVLHNASPDYRTPYDTTGFLPGDDSHRPVVWLGAVAPVAALAPGLALANSALTAATLGLTWVPDTAGGGWFVLDRDGDGQYGAIDDTIRLDGVADPRPATLLDGSVKLVQHGTPGNDHLVMPLAAYDPNAWFIEHLTAAPPPTSYLVESGAGDDTLEGNNGNDTLAGGPGADWLIGGAGQDTYLVDSQADVIFEASNLLSDGGYSLLGHDDRDTAIASAGYQLYANVEDLVLTEAAGDAHGVGNELGNRITGNTGANLLIGLEGDDTLLGGDGADALFGGEGTDRLDGGAGLDMLLGGSANDTLDGGAETDLLYGETGDDSLVGGQDFVFDQLVGGEGNDTLDGASDQGDHDNLYGGTGDDAFHVDTPADLVFEFAGEGNDTVHASITGAGYYLYDNIEDLVLLGATPFGVGNALDNHLTGSAGTNWLLGGAGADTLNGKAGNDVLFGEAGADVFVFERGTGGDVIGDFTPGEDRIQLLGLGGTGFAQLQGQIRVVGADAAIDLGQGDVIVIHGVTGFTVGDFVFG